MFDKDKGTVSLMNARFLEKHLLGYRRKSEYSALVKQLVNCMPCDDASYCCTLFLVYILITAKQLYLSTCLTRIAQTSTVNLYVRVYVCMYVCTCIAVVTELSEIVAVSVEEQKMPLGGRGFMVCVCA